MSGISSLHNRRSHAQQGGGGLPRLIRLPSAKSINIAAAAAVANLISGASRNNSGSQASQNAVNATAATSSASTSSIVIMNNNSCPSSPAVKKSYRLVVVGSAASGKTALVRRLLDPASGFDERYLPTIEEFHRRLYKVKGEVIQLDVIDRSGHEPFPAARRLAYSSGDLFLVVGSVDNAASVEQMGEIYEEIMDCKLSSWFPSANGQMGAGSSRPVSRHGSHNSSPASGCSSANAPSSATAKFTFNSGSSGNSTAFSVRPPVLFVLNKSDLAKHKWEVSVEEVKELVQRIAAPVAAAAEHGKKREQERMKAAGVVTTVATSEYPSSSSTRPLLPLQTCSAATNENVGRVFSRLFTSAKLPAKILALELGAGIAASGDGREIPVNSGLRWRPRVRSELSIDSQMMGLQHSNEVEQQDRRDSRQQEKTKSQYNPAVSMIRRIRLSKRFSRSYSSAESEQEADTALCTSHHGDQLTNNHHQDFGSIPTGSVEIPTASNNSCCTAQSAMAAGMLGLTATTPAAATRKPSLRTDLLQSRVRNSMHIATTTTHGVVDSPPELVGEARRRPVSSSAAAKVPSVVANGGEQLKGRRAMEPISPFFYNSQTMLSDADRTMGVVEKVGENHYPCKRAASVPTVGENLRAKENGCRIS